MRIILLLVALMILSPMLRRVLSFLLLTLLVLYAIYGG